MLSKKLLSALNTQIQAEISSAHLYLAMAAYFASLNLNGFEKWMTAQYHEELEHAKKFFDFIHDRDGRAEIKDIPTPKADFKSIMEVCKTALGNEKLVSKKITELYELALEEKDYPTQMLLHWFLTEQVEEEKQVEEIISKLELTSDHDGTLLMLDKELGERK